MASLTSVHISSIDDDAFNHAFDNLPPWATEDTLTRIEKHAKDSLSVQTEILNLLKQSGGAGGASGSGGAGGGTGGGTGGGNNRTVEDELKRIAELLEREHKRDKNKEPPAIMSQLNKIVSLVTSNEVVKKLSSLSEYLYTLNSAGVLVTQSAGEVGHAFGAIRNLAVETGISLNSLTKTITEHTSINTMGVQTFAKAQKSIQEGMAKFGYSAKDAANAAGDYTDALGNLSNIQTLNADDLSKNSVKYSEEIFRLSLITGKARSELYKSVTTMTNSIDAYVIAIQSTAQVAQNMSAFASSFSNVDVGNKILEMMSAQVPVLNTTFQNFAKAGLGGFAQEFMNFNKTLAAADVSPARAALMTKQFVESIGNIDELITQQKLLAESGVAGASENLKMLIDLKKTAAKNKELSEEEVARQEKSNEALAKVKTQWEKLMSVFDRYLAPTDSMLNLVSSVLGGITWVLEGVLTIVTKVFGVFGSIFSPAADIGKDILTYAVLLYAGIKLLNPAISLFRGVISSLVSAIGKLFSWSFGGAGTPSSGSRSTILERLAKGLRALGSKRAILGTVTLAGVVGNIALLGLALQTFESVTLAGMGKAALAVTGLTALTFALSKLKTSITSVALIFAMAASLSVLGTALIKFNEVNFNSILLSAAALTVLTGALFALSFVGPMALVGVLGIIGLSAGLLLTAKAFEIVSVAVKNSVASITALSKIDVKSIAMLGPALISASTGLAAFSLVSTASSLLNIGKSIGDSISSLFSGDSTMNQLKELAAIAPGLQTAANAMSILSSSISKLVETIDKLKDVNKIKELVTEINKLDLAKSKAMTSALTIANSLTSPKSNKIETVKHESRNIVESEKSKTTQVTNSTNITSATNKFTTNNTSTVELSDLKEQLNSSNDTLSQIYKSLQDLISVDRDVLKYMKKMA